jgi:polyisoprenoid-binding protein YceI
LKRYLSIAALVVGVGLVGLQLAGAGLQAQGAAAPQGAAPAAPAAGRGPAPLPTFDTSKPAKLDLTTATARYRVKEQLVGVSFMNDAVGTTDKVTGTIVILPNGSFAPQSKLTVDMKSLNSDQELRDGYIRARVLDAEKFPTLEFVPKRAQGLPAPLPSQPTAQALGFQMIGDMTLKGVTKEVTFNIASTLRGATVAGVATTSFKFADFNLPKPAVPLLLSAEDTINLEVEFRAARSVAQ